MRKNVLPFLVLSFLTAACVGAVYAQKAKPKPSPTLKTRPAIFSVIYGGSGIEPIAFVENGKLVAGGNDGSADGSTLSKLYYKPGAKYDLIFGGISDGTVTVKKSNVGSECGGSSAEVTVASTKAKLKGFVMGLATNITPKGKATGLRRIPTTAERAEMESLVRAEYAKQKIASAAYKQLHYHNLTAVDVENNGSVEFVGSYWVEPKASERGLLFFIAEKGARGKYAFSYHTYENYTVDKVMSGQLKDLDDGVYQTLLLDAFDYDSDGTAEIFTVSKAFEGNNYSVLKRTKGTWTKVLDTYDYRCGY